jgi:hypothetical protein
MQSQRNRAGEVGAITTVLTERPKMVRMLLFDQLVRSAIGISDALDHDKYGVAHARLRPGTEKHIYQRLAELQECVVLLAQVGWR